MIGELQVDEDTLHANRTSAERSDIHQAHLTGKGVAPLATLAIFVSIFLASTFLTKTSAAPVPERDPASPTVRIGVLGLFHTAEFIVTPAAHTAIVLHAGADEIVLEPSSALKLATIQVDGNSLRITAGQHVLHPATIVVTGRNDDAAEFILSVPAKISRRYHGTLEINSSSRELIAIVRMDLETAVASVLAAESGPATPIESLKAQAIAVRSYLVAARGRHHDFDFCDTTHCQFLREPPASDSPEAAATAATRGLVLAYQSVPFAAMYTRSCSGRTHTPAEIGLPVASYPYYSVECEYCRSHPQRWVRQFPARKAAALRSSDETSRLNAVRVLGWNAVPSNDFILRKEGDQVVLHGTGEGHGIGLCQSGAKAMAEAGASFQQILSHYYPNSAIVTLPPRS